jgi:molybdenum cofactor cytidylyltransferase
MDKQTTLPISIIILAAGSSTRMGTPKQNLNWYGMPLIVYQVKQALNSRAKEVVVILGNQINENKKILTTHLGPTLNNIHLIENSEWGSGKTTSVKLGIRNISEDSTDVMLWASDSPRPTVLLDDLMANHVGNNNLITYPWHKDKEGHPGVFSLSLRQDLLSIQEKSKGLREIVKKYEENVVKLQMFDPISVVNLNTMAEYTKALLLTGQPEL